MLLLGLQLMIILKQLFMGVFSDYLINHLVCKMSDNSENLPQHFP